MTNTLLVHSFSACILHVLEIFDQLVTIHQIVYYTVYMCHINAYCQAFVVT